MRYIYGSLFDWLVKTINNSFTVNMVTAPLCIGMLDLAGFENLSTNGFEQVLIIAHTTLHFTIANWYS